MAIPTPIPSRLSAIKESGNDDSLSRSDPNNNHVEDHSETSSNSPKPQSNVNVDNAESASTDSPSRRNRNDPCEAAVFPQNHRAEDSIQMRKTASRGHVDEIWISIKDVKLVTRPTLVPPPSRPPPKPRSKQGYASRKPSYSKTEVNHDSVTDSNGFAARDTGKISGLSSRSKGARAGAKLRLSEEVQEKEREEKDKEAGAAKVREEQVKAREVRERVDKMAREKEKKEKARQREEKERESRAIRRREERERELRHRKETDKAAEAHERAKRAVAEKAATAREQQDASLDEHHVSSTDGQPRTSDMSPATAPGDFPEVEGESAERRRSRLERHLRILERSATALHEKNQRDLQSQKDQAERHRAAETLDIKIKRWAAGKEGNLRALLSTLQYVLWPESGWQAVSLRDLITTASVKQVYRKATVCVHPDKLQQRGATILQKYTAEKVFHLLNEAWNKFKSGELLERVN